MEIWKDIKGYEGLYQISNHGRVKSLDRFIIDKNGVSKFKKGCVLKQGSYSNGYKFVQLRPIITQHNWSVHRLVAIHFIDNPLNKQCINHKDCNRTNNHVDNLEWCTHSENTLHSRIHGSAKFCYIEKPITIKHSITNEIKHFETQSALCKFFGKSKCWLYNKRKQVQFPLLWEGWWIE
jgi:hypothetical protein